MEGAENFNLVIQFDDGTLGRTLRSSDPDLASSRSDSRRLAPLRWHIKVHSSLLSASHTYAEAHTCILYPHSCIPFFPLYLKDMRQTGETS